MDADEIEEYLLSAEEADRVAIDAVTATRNEG